MRLKMLDNYRATIAPAMKMARNYAPMPDFSREVEKARNPMTIPHPPKPITITSTITLDLDDTLDADAELEPWQRQIVEKVYGEDRKMTVFRLHAPRPNTLDFDDDRIPDEG